MTAAMDISVTKVERSRLMDMSLENLPFGKYFTDHMLEADYENGEWKNIEIKPYQPLLLSPSLAALHYGQAIFEGIKAYKDAEGQAYIFRPQDNFARFNISAERMQMPAVPEELFMEGMRQLIELIRTGSLIRKITLCISGLLCSRRMNSSGCVRRIIINS
jgi:branched-chain amino acid aminotransferase